MKSHSRIALAAVLGCMMFRSPEPGNDGAGASTVDPKAAAAAQAKAEKEAKAAQVKAEKEAKAAAKKAEAEAAKAKKEQEKAEAKAKKEADAAAAKAKKEADAAAKKAEAEAKKQAKEAAKQPSQNGVTRPKPEGACGKVWSIADALSSKRGSPTPIADVLTEGKAAGINDSTIRTQYARWRKYHNVTGRIVDEKAPAASTGAGTEQQGAAA